MGEQRKESMPCIICGRRLMRVSDEYEAQADDAVMCSTSGNYGSTVYDPMNGEVLLFNICDKCLVAAGNHKNARIVTHRRSIPVTTDVPISDGRWVVSGVGSRVIADDPLVPWNETLERRDETEYLPVEYLAEHLDELLANDRYRFTLGRDNFQYNIDQARKEGRL